MKDLTQSLPPSPVVGPQVKVFFDRATNTISYVARDPHAGRGHADRPTETGAPC